MQIEPAQAENYTECVRSLETATQKARQFARNRSLDCLGTLSRGHKNNCICFLYAHYVFDDQRAAFDSQLAAMRKVGTFVNTDTAISMAKGDQKVDGCFFHLSFDDGLACLYRNAVPVLRKHSIPAIVFVNSAVAGDPTLEERLTWERGTNYKKSLQTMAWDMIRDSGLEVGAHTRTHRRLSEISDSTSALRAEVRGCKEEIEGQLGKPCRYFAWPFGQLSDVDKSVLETIKSAGYEAAFGGYREKVTPGQINLFSIPRQHFEPQWPVRHLRYFVSQA